MDFSKGIEYRDSWRIACLRKPIFCHVINIVILVKSCDLVHGDVVPGVVVHAWVGWVGEIKYGLIAAARGAFTS